MYINMCWFKSEVPYTLINPLPYTPSPLHPNFPGLAWTPISSTPPPPLPPPTSKILLTLIYHFKSNSVGLASSLRRDVTATTRKYATISRPPHRFPVRRVWECPSRLGTFKDCLANEGCTLWRKQTMGHSRGANSNSEQTLRQWGRHCHLL